MREAQEKSLHELNQEYLRFDRQRRSANEKAADAARSAVVNTLDQRLPNGKRIQKDLRPAGV